MRKIPGFIYLEKKKEITSKIAIVHVILISGNYILRLLSMSR